MATDTELSTPPSGGFEELSDVNCYHCLEDGESKKAEVYCVDCDMHYCRNCLKYHDIIPSSRDHQTVNKSQPTDGRTRTALPTERCVIHDGKIKDMYCEDHEVVCCDACLALKHRSCLKVDYLSDAARGINDSLELKDFKSKLHSVHCELRGEKARSLDNISSLEKEKETILVEINQLEEDLTNNLRILATTSREKLDCKLSESKKPLADDIKLLNTAITTTVSAEENITDGNEAEIFTKVVYGKSVIKANKDLIADISKQFNRKMLYFVENFKLKSIVNESDHIGIVYNELDKEMNEKHSEMQETQLKKEIFVTEVSKEKQHILGGGEILGKQEGLQYMATVFGKHKISESDCAVTAACILNDTILMLFDCTNLCLNKLEMDDFKINDQLKMNGQSFSLCSVGTEEVAVALYFDKKIQLVSIGRTMTLARSFSTNHLCRGVAFNEVSGQFFVCNLGNQVNRYSATGKLINTYTTYPKRGSMFSTTCNVAWSEDNTIIFVTDCVKGLVAFNTAGDVLWTYKDPEMKRTHGLCVLPGDDILVSDIISNKVIQIGKHGQKIGTVIDGQNVLDQPWALVFNRKMSRLVVGHQSNEIYVYKLEQK